MLNSKTRNSTIAILFTPLILASCGGGEGGKSTPARPINTSISDATVSYDANQKVSSVRTNVDGKTVTYTINGDLKVDDQVPDEYIVNGVGPVSTALNPLGTVYGTYLDDDGNVYSYAAHVEDVSTIDPNLDIVQSNFTGTYTYTGVEYGYTSSSNGSINDEVFADDGYIEVNTNRGTWDAQMGPEVTLDGYIVGMDVYGTADWNGVSGTFEGYDGVFTNNGTAFAPVTGGAFVGNDDDDSFAGGWYHIEE